MAPTITSNGGGPTAAITVPENQTAVTTVMATDPDLPPGILTYSLIGGDDRTALIINGSSGRLSFVTPPDFENPPMGTTTGSTTSSCRWQMGKGAKTRKPSP